MKRIPCEYFGEGEKIYFNIGRILQLEAVLKKPIGRILAEGLGMTEVLVPLRLGLRTTNDVPRYSIKKKFRK